MEQNDQVVKQVRNLFKNNLLQPSKSPHAVEIVLAKKKDVNIKFIEWRMCMDYRLLNKYNRCIRKNYIFTIFLRAVLNHLRDVGLTLNLPKSVFFPRKLKYLGQVIENGRIIPDQKKVEALQ